MGFYFFNFIYFWLYHVAYGILVPQPEIEPVPSVVRAQSPNHWTTRESLLLDFLADVYINDCFGALIIFFRV